MEHYEQLYQTFDPDRKNILVLFLMAPEFKIQSEKRIESYCFFSKNRKKEIFTYDFNDPAAVRPHDEKILADLDSLCNIGFLSNRVIEDTETSKTHPRNTNIYKLTRWGSDFAKYFLPIIDKEIPATFSDIIKNFNSKPLVSVIEEAQKNFFWNRTD